MKRDLSFWRCETNPAEIVAKTWRQLIESKHRKLAARIGKKQLFVYEF
jgi:hypothetical protein